MNENGTETPPEVAAPPPPLAPEGTPTPPFKSPWFVDADLTGDAGDEEAEEAPLLAVDVPSISQMMRQEITDVLGEEPTPESCEAAGAMLTATRDFLLAQRAARFGRLSPNPTLENLKRLAQVFGLGADDNDPVP